MTKNTKPFAPRFPETYGRDDEVDAVLKALRGGVDRSVLLVGRRGVGKRSIAREANRKASKSNPGDRAGAFGEWTFVEAVDALFDARRLPVLGDDAVRQAEKIEQQEARIVGTVTPARYLKIIAWRPELARLFEVIWIGDLDLESSSAAVAQAAEVLFAGVLVSKPLCEKIAALASAADPRLGLPGAAIDLLRRTVAVVERVGAQDPCVLDEGHLVEALAQLGARSSGDDAGARKLRIDGFVRAAVEEFPAARAVVERAAVALRSSQNGVVLGLRGAAPEARYSLARLLAQALFDDASRVVEISAGTYGASGDRALRIDLGWNSADFLNVLAAELGPSPQCVVVCDPATALPRSIEEALLDAGRRGVLRAPSGLECSLRNTVLAVAAREHTAKTAPTPEPIVAETIVYGEAGVRGAKWIDDAITESVPTKREPAESSADGAESFETQSIEPGVTQIGSESRPAEAGGAVLYLEVRAMGQDQIQRSDEERKTVGVEFSNVVREICSATSISHMKCTAGGLFVGLIGPTVALDVVAKLRERLASADAEQPAQICVFVGSLLAESGSGLESRELDRLRSAASVARHLGVNRASNDVRVANGEPSILFFRKGDGPSDALRGRLVYSGQHRLAAFKSAVEIWVETRPKNVSELTPSEAIFGTTHRHDMNVLDLWFERRDRDKE